MPQYQYTDWIQEPDYEVEGNRRRRSMLNANASTNITDSVPINSTPTAERQRAVQEQVEPLGKGARFGAGYANNTIIAGNDMDYSASKSMDFHTGDAQSGGNSTVSIYSGVQNTPPPVGGREVTVEWENAWPSDYYYGGFYHLSTPVAARTNGVVLSSNAIWTRQAVTGLLRTWVTAPAWHIIISAQHDALTPNYDDSDLWLADYTYEKNAVLTTLFEADFDGDTISANLTQHGVMETPIPDFDLTPYMFTRDQAPSVAVHDGYIILRIEGHLTSPGMPTPDYYNSPSGSITYYTYTDLIDIIYTMRPPKYRYKYLATGGWSVNNLRVG